MFSPKNIFLPMLTLAVLTTTAQNTDSLLWRMETVFRKTVEYEATAVQSKTPLKKGVELFFVPLDSMPDLKDSLLVSQYEDIKGNIGLSLRASGRYNIMGSPLEDDEVIAQGRTLFRTGIYWNLLRAGMAENKKTAKILSVERELHQVETARKNSQSVYGLRYQNIIYEFYKKSEQLLAYRLEFLKQQKEILYELYYRRQVYYEQILDCKKKIAVVNNQLDEVQSFCQGYMGSVEIVDYPIFEIDLEKILEKIDSSTVVQHLIELKQARQQMLFRKNSLVSFQLYAQVQAIQNNNREHRVTPAIGFQLSMPLKKNMGKRSFDIAQEQIEQAVTDTEENRIKEVRVHYLGFMEKLKQWKRIDYQIQITKEQLLTIKILNKQLNPETFISSFDLMNQMMELRYEAHQLQCQMYLQTLGIGFAAKIENALEFVKFVRPPTMGQLGYNLAAIWHVEKDLKGSSLLMSYLKRMKIQKIYLKGSKEHYNHGLLQQMLLSEGFQLIEDYDEYESRSAKAISSILGTMPKEDHMAKKYIIDDVHKLVAFEKTRFNEKVQF